MIRSRRGEDRSPRRTFGSGIRCRSDADTFRFDGSDDSSRYIIVIGPDAASSAVYGQDRPGQPIELEVRLNGVRDGRFFFFVQNGLVNGGYTGQLSDPLVLSPSP